MIRIVDKANPSDVASVSSEYCTVYFGKSEVIVYGSGSDWIVRYANTTNAYWTRWFSDRTKAEYAARDMASKEYSGQKGLEKHDYC